MVLSETSVIQLAPTGTNLPSLHPSPLILLLILSICSSFFLLLSLLVTRQSAYLSLITATDSKCQLRLDKRAAGGIIAAAVSLQAPSHTHAEHTRTSHKHTHTFALPYSIENALWNSWKNQWGKICKAFLIKIWRSSDTGQTGRQGDRGQAEQAEGGAA